MNAHLPDGFAVRLHDDVAVGEHLRRGSRRLRWAAEVRELIEDREVRVSSSLSAKVAGRLLDLDLAVPVLAENAATLAEVTVVVPVKDRAEGVDRLLAGLASHVRCIVVDDASADPESLAAVAKRHEALLLRLDENVGPAAARNLGLRRVTTEYVAFIDSDIEISVESLTRLVAHLVDPGLAAVAPRVRTRGGRRWFERYEDASGSLDLGTVSAIVRPWSEVTHVPSACLLVRVEAMGDGFDPAMRSGEDVDLVWRLHDRGWRIRYAPEVDVHHDSRALFRDWLGRKFFYGTSAAPLAARHGDKVAPAMLLPAAAAAAGAVLVRRRWSLVLAVLLSGRVAKIARADAQMVTGATIRQIAGLGLRHWWPISLGSALISKRGRQALLISAVADGILAHRAADTDLDAVRYTAARRLDDLAYGAGVWSGAIKARSIRCLLPRWIRVPE